jgi:hypothetical protein
MAHTRMFTRYKNAVAELEDVKKAHGAQLEEALAYVRHITQLYVQTKLDLDALERVVSDYQTLKRHYALAQRHVGTLLAINNKYHGKRTRYDTFDGDYTRAGTGRATQKRRS